MCQTAFDWEDGARDYPMHRCSSTCSKCTQCNNINTTVVPSFWTVEGVASNGEGISTMGSGSRNSNVTTAAATGNEIAPTAEATAAIQPEASNRTTAPPHILATVSTPPPITTHVDSITLESIKADTTELQTDATHVDSITLETVGTQMDTTEPKTTAPSNPPVVPVNSLAVVPLDGSAPGSAAPNPSDATLRIPMVDVLGTKLSEAFQDGQFDPLVKNYINFHRSAIKDGRLKDGFPYVVYRCSDKERCGGVGDRVLSIVRAFYFAMATGRVLLIDSKFPVELKTYLNPNFVKWDAEVPLTKKTFNDMNERRTISRRENIIGYYLGRCNGTRRYTISKIIESQYMQALIQQSAQGPLSELSVPRAFHQAFWAMFKFDDAVLSRAEEMKKRAGLALPSYDSNSFIQGSNSRKEMASYIGLHNRHGDKSISGVNSTWVQKQSRDSNSTELLECYHQFQRISPGKYPAAYLASDDHDTKKLMKGKDRTIHYPPEVNIFHVDLSTRNGTGVTSLANDDIHQGVLDTWAEVAVLVDSDCLVMSRSMFAFLAYYIRGETTCNVYIMDCNAATVAKKMNTYSEDPISMIYNTIETVVKKGAD
eukprot:CAMPEP_0194272930 /NCGR_PEP_ID=MMETSP0169-20130528/6377_1 /TAXON_ID=218684 /ORGANISM="Corethron pennatum, Strain L29A3" /LENGTH=595 /DNA_ID=CAMNT_0039015723 /DNA_START=50 /DNA_END=1838 /DNA_ORIENTATION=-